MTQNQENPLSHQRLLDHVHLLQKMTQKHKVLYSLDSLKMETQCSFVYEDKQKNCVVKLIKNNTSGKTTKREIAANEIVKECNHILKLVDCVSLDDFEFPLFLMFEPICKSDLFEIVVRSPNKTPEFIIAGYIKQILYALIFCHDHKIVHCDIKPENMLLQKDNKNVLLCDFGHCQINQEFF